ncbi:hypothetical protein L1987_52866 [Smallanthus sonchifolius]|uniref:Uncharacterized protein n=1 Tax=Smallanthus sonchifolius TaxID=185202 RepID=A0ACB9EUN5_9ASTR|nr:hypothetical protein L1987_52866 [Smallanthus sonchifolius]
MIYLLQLPLSRRVNVERAITTSGTSIDQEGNDNFTKTLTTTTHSEDVSLETLFTERNPRCQENQGDGDAEARPKAPSSSKDSTTVDEDKLKLQNLELTARVAMLEAEVSKLRHQQVAFQSSLFKPAFVQIHDFPDSVDEEEDITEDWKLVVRAMDEVLKNESQNEDAPLSFSKLPAAANISRQTIAPQFTLTAHKLEFDSILAWGYDGLSEILDWTGVWWNIRAELECTESTSELAIDRFYVLMEDNLPCFERLLEEANRVAYPEHHAESLTTSEQRLAPRFNLIRSSTLTEEVLCWRRFFYNEVVRGLEVQIWSSTGFSGFQIFLSDGSSFTINNIQEILLLNPNFLHKEKEESEEVPSSVSIPNPANEAEVEIPTTSLTSAVVIHEAEAEVSNKDKGKGIMTEEEEERLKKEKRKRKRRRREREEEEMGEFRNIQERKAEILLREQQMQLHARQLDALKVKIPTATQLQEDEALAL